MESFVKSAKEASRTAQTLSGEIKNSVLRQMADALVKKTTYLIDENKKDINFAQENNLSSAMIDRLLLDEKRVEAMAEGLRQIASLKEPVGRMLDGWVTDKGLRIGKISVPIGVIAIIYESRPNVTADAAALCFKSGNVALLKGGKEATYSNKAIATILQDVLVENALPQELISLIPDGSREGVAKLIKMDRYVDLVIPRGGEGLIRFVCENATVPVVKHDKGVCHVYVDKEADTKKALDIIINAKCQRPGVCNAMECLLVDETIAKSFLPQVKALLDGQNTVLHGCEKTVKIVDIDLVGDEAFHTEYLANELNIKIVDGVQGAVEHISVYGSGHSEAIITENITTSYRFTQEVDAACVYVNASTRFTDGAEFGFGAEVGISTNKLHSRGPMGINDLTTYKYIITGEGHIR